MSRVPKLLLSLAPAFLTHAAMRPIPSSSENRGGELRLLGGRGAGQVEVRNGGQTEPVAFAGVWATPRGVSRVTWISHQRRRMFTPVAKRRRKLKNCDFPATRW